MFGKLFNGKRGQGWLDQAPALILTLVIVGVVGAIGLAVLDGVGDGFTGPSADAINNITTAIANFFALTPVLGTIFIAIILLAAVAGLGAWMWMRNR